MDNLQTDRSMFDLDRIMSELPNGFATFDREWRYTYANNRLLEIFKLSRAEVLGKKAWDVFPHQVGMQHFDLLNRAMTEGVAAQFEFYYELVGYWVEHHVYPTADGLAIIMTDVSDRKQAEKELRRAAKLDAFRLTLANALRPLRDPVEIQATASLVLGEHLGANRVLYFEIRGDYYVVERDYVNGAMALSGGYPVESFGTNLLTALYGGQVICVSDIAADPNLSPTERSAFAAVQIDAHINIPLIKGGEFVAGLAVHSSAPRVWTPDEVALVEEVADRTWAAIERERAQAVLRVNEERTRIQKEAFQSAINGEPLASSLNSLARIVKQQLGSDVRTAFYLGYPDGASLHAIEGAGDMPETYLRLMDGFAISEDSFCSGCAIATGRPTLTRDVLENPQWQPYLDLATAHNFRSCGSYPILTREGRAIGSFAMYFTEVHDATPQEFAVAEAITQAAAIILSRHTEALDRARAEEAVAADLRDTQLLRELAARSISEGDFQTLYREILSAAIVLTRADAGSVQILDDTTQELVLLATQGFNVTMTDRFDRLDASSHTSCGVALRNGTRTFIDFDGPESEDPDGSLRMHVDAGYLSAQSTLLITRSGKAIGMISTHWRKHHRPCDRELRFLDLLVRQAADAIEQRQIAIALCESEEQLRLATEASQLGLWYWDLETDSLTWTGQCKALFGLSADTQMSYTVFLAAIHPDDRDRTQAAVSQSIADRTDYDIEYRTCWQDGTTHWIAAKGSCTYDPTGKPVQMMGVALNITTLKQAEAALREKEAKLRFMLDASQIGEWDLDLTTQPHTAHRSLLHDQIFGYESLLPEWSYEIFLTHVHPEDRAAVDEKFQQTLIKGTDWNFECRVIHADRSIHWIWSRSSVYYDSSRDTPTRLLGMVVDFTDRKQAQIDLADRNQELDSFVYVVSHDLKAPLRAISNLSHWIEEDFGPEISVGIREQMALLRDRVQRMETMINGLLQYARVGRTDDQIQVVCVAELLAEILDSLAPPPTFEIIIPSDLPTFRTKRLMLSQVFANLINNAFKHHDRTDGCIQISYRERGDVYEFAVADDGPGIPPEQHDRVFVIFQSTNPQKKSDSTGIGLSIVKKIVETAGGQIRLESELGKGTTFYFTWLKSYKAFEVDG